MPAVTLTLADLEPFATIDPYKADAMIEDALAIAARVAPCIMDAAFEHDGAARAVIRRAVLRWNDSGTGAVTTQQAGPFGQTLDTRQPHRSLFWPSEITDLQDLCRETSDVSAFAVDTVTYGVEVHSETCALRFGANYCDCGAIYAGYPLFETS